MQRNAAYVAFDPTGLARRYYDATCHVFDRGNANRDVSPEFDDLRPLDLQDPTWRERALVSVSDPEPSSAAEPRLTANRPKRTNCVSVILD